MKADDIYQIARRDFQKIQTTLRNERMQCLQDRRFCSIAGAQWEGPLGDQFENKPRFEVNKIHMAVTRIVSEYRNNRITVDFIGKDGERADKLAETCAGLYRADEVDSCAEEAYDNAFEEAVTGGFGAFRLRTEYENPEDDEDDRQRIRIEPIFDADTSVFFDLNAKRQDKSDAKFCFVVTSMSPEAYKEEFNDDPASWPKEIHQVFFDWYTPSVVYVAEYYRVEMVSDTIHTLEFLDGKVKKLTQDEFDEEGRMMLATGWKKVKEKKTKKQRVHKYILSGSGILEDCGLIAGRNIPIVPVYGKRWFVDNVERCMGHVRLAKDAQRLKNMQLSKLGEVAAFSSIEKPIFVPEQVANHQLMWADDTIKNYPYLLVNPVSDANGNQVPTGPVAYTKSADIPPALAGLLAVTEADMQDILGNQTQADKVVSHVSGKAVEMIQNRLDMQSAIYMSNMGKAIRRCGEIWLSMARDIFVEAGRKVKVMKAEGKPASVELNTPVIDEETGDIVYENDLSEAEFDVVADVGPSSISRRAAAVRAIIGMMQVTQDPETLQVLSSMAMMNMEGEGISDARSFFRKKLVMMGVIEPTEEESQLMQAQQQQQDAQSKYLEAAAEQAKATADKNRADVMLTVARTEETRAKTMRTLSEVDGHSVAIADKMLAQ